MARATGTVAFTVDGGAPVTVVVNSAGQALWTSSTLGLGSHVVSATYGGDVRYAGGVAGSVSFTVVKGDLTTTLRSLRNPVPTGGRARIQSISKLVSPATGSALSTVTFTADNGATAPTVATVPTNSIGTALWQPVLPNGRWTITSVHNGTANFNSSRSGPVTVLVGPQSTVDAQHVATTQACRPFSPGYPIAQTFTPTRSGTLDKVSLDVVWIRDWAGAEDMQVEIQSIGRFGHPSGTVLGRGRLSVADSQAVNGGQELSQTMSEITLSEPASVGGGQQYALVLQSDSWWCAGNTYGGVPYSGGLWTWGFNGTWSGVEYNDRDLVYKIWIK